MLPTQRSRHSSLAGGPSIEGLASTGKLLLSGIKVSMHGRRLFGARYLVKSEEEAKHCGLDEPVSNFRPNEAIMRLFHAHWLWRCVARIAKRV